MTALEWDKVGERRFEAGLDRGVLYLLDGRAVAWNGLTQVSEDASREVKEYWLDGVKYLDHFIPGAYSGKLQAFTYPDELEEIVGNRQFAPGVFLHDQPTQMFHLSYRTKVGNDVDGVDHGYKLHILYNLQINPSSGDANTIGQEIAPGVLEWNLSGTPAQMFGVRPTSHISLHSRAMDPEVLATLEALLYGTDGVTPTDPELPDLVTLLGLIPGGSG
jgi:hypothetical protein